MFESHRPAIRASKSARGEDVIDGRGKTSTSPEESSMERRPKEKREGGFAGLVLAKA